MENTNTSTEKKSVAITPDVLRKHWQGHRRVTRRLIEAFPEDKLFTYSIGGMRPASELFLEMIGMSKPGMNGVATGFWDTPGHHKNQDKPTTRHDLLRLWDEVTNQIDELWSQIPASRSLKSMWRSDSGKDLSTALSSIGSTMRSTTGVRPTSTCARSASNLRYFGIESNSTNISQSCSSNYGFEQYFNFLLCARLNKPAYAGFFVMSYSVTSFTLIALKNRTQANLTNAQDD
jgi:hypothetical protein